MSVELTEHADGKVIEVALSGKLTKEDYEHFVPVFEKRIKEHGKISLLVILNEFHGWEMAAAWEDLKFDVHHFHDIEKLALVGESKWQKGMAWFCKPFTSAEIRYVGHDEIDEVRAWVSS